jgi:hypothetical protein
LVKKINLNIRNSKLLSQVVVDFGAIFLSI